MVKIQQTPVYKNLNFEGQATVNFFIMITNSNLRLLGSSVGFKVVVRAEILPRDFLETSGNNYL